MELLDRIREAWDDLRGTQKEQLEASVRQSNVEQPVESSADHVHAVPPRESADPLSVGAPSDQTESVLRAAVANAIEELERYTGRRFDEGRLNEGRHYEDHSSYREITGHMDMGMEEDLRAYSLEVAVGKHVNEFRLETVTDDIATYNHQPTGNRIHVDSSGILYEKQDGEELTMTTRAAVLRAYQEPSPELSATLSADHREAWVPLEKELGFRGADAFDHYGKRGDVHIYGTEWMESKWQLGLDSKGQFYDVSGDGPATPISREDALRNVHFEPTFYTPAELHLREAVGNSVVPDLQRDPYPAKGETIQSYEYLPTGSSIHIDSEGKFYNAQRGVITRDEALSAMNDTKMTFLSPMASPPPYAPSGAPGYEGLPHQVAPELATSETPFQSTSQQQAISL